MNQQAQRKDGLNVLISFIAFFLLIIAVNTVFITQALSTHSGVITDKPYEKGLAYNDMLAQAKGQANINDQTNFKDNTLRWVLSDEDGHPVDAVVHARMIWPVKSGLDFEVPLQQIEKGVYQAQIDFPKQGQWQAKLGATWNNQNYQKLLTLTVK